MIRYLLIAFQLTLMMAAPAARGADLVIDGVSLPADASVASVAKSATDLQRRWSGVWTGAWNGAFKHILLVERIGEDGAAGVVYAEADNPYTGAPASWWRLDAVVSGRTLTVTRPAFIATYEMDDEGQLKAFFKGSRIARAAMSRTDLASLTKPGAVVAWSRGTSELLQTDLLEDGNPIRLETVIFKPRRGRFRSRCSIMARPAELRRPNLPGKAGPRSESPLFATG